MAQLGFPINGNEVSTMLSVRSCLVIALSLCLSACATVASGGWGGAAGGTSGYGDPVPAGMAVACKDFNPQNSAINVSGMVTTQSKPDVDGCVVTYHCDAGPCRIEVTSRMFPGGTNINLLADIRDERPNLGPAAVGGTPPKQEPYKIGVAPGGWYGTSAPMKTASIYTANGKWIRYSSLNFIERDQVPKTMTAVIEFTGPVSVGRIGWVQN